MHFKPSKISLCFSVLLTLSSCVPAAIVGGGVVGYTMVQERTVGDAIDDVSIETEINALLLDSKDKGLFQNVDVDSVEGAVLLTGTVPTRQAKLDVYKMAWRPSAVKKVINEINVKAKSEFSASKYASDAWISAQIESKILFARDISSVNYSIETIDGVVYLMGVAQNKDELQKVAEIASTVSGVNRVVSYVRIKGKKYPGVNNATEVYNSANPTPVEEEEIEALETTKNSEEVEPVIGTRPRSMEGKTPRYEGNY